jgi:ADP-L-glycero-D-manno-heptose 6-epimerase
MASTLFHWYNQLQQDKQLKLFQESMSYYRDFIYVEDVAQVIWHFMNNYKPGVYDVGTGSAHNFETVADQMLKNLKGKKKYIDMPEDLQKQYQTWTQADTSALTFAGIDISKFRTLKQGVEEYLEYLKAHRYY